MKSKTFPEVNTTFTAPGCFDVPAFKGEGVVITAWEMTEEEIEVFLKTKTFYLMFHGEGMPPISLFVGYPFRDTAEYPETIEEKP